MEKFLLWVGVVTVVIILAILLGTAIHESVHVPDENTLNITPDGWGYPPGRFIDHEACVVCWYSRSMSGGLSCLPVEDTNLEVDCR